MTSTPNPTTSKTQQLLDQQADAFDSAKSFLSHQTPNSPSRGTPARFRRTPTLQTVARVDTPSKLLRTLSRATSRTPTLEPHEEQSSYNNISQYQSLATPALKGRLPPAEESEDELSVDEAEKTLDSIIESADESNQHVRRVLEHSRQERSIRHSLSPPNTSRTDDLRQSEDGMDVGTPAQAEMSVWGEKSFFRRMASKAPGGWAFTPQPKLGRMVDVPEEEEVEKDQGDVDVPVTGDFVKVCQLSMSLMIGTSNRRPLVGILANTTERNIHQRTPEIQPTNTTISIKIPSKTTQHHLSNPTRPTIVSQHPITTLCPSSIIGTIRKTSPPSPISTTSPIRHPLSPPRHRNP
jgi:hypothetical protein